MAEQENPVRLAYATTQDSLTLVRVKVRDLATVERVHVRCRRGPDWDDVELPRTAHHLGYDTYSDAIPRPDEFAILYSAGSTDYWDNNAFRNYRVPVWSNAIGGHVSLHRARLTVQGLDRRWLRGEIYVDNTSYGKKVGILLRPDSTSRWLDVTGIYDGIAREGEGAPWVKGPVERWKFTSPAFDSSDCRFAVFYHEQDSGTVFWDNNFGQDFRFGKDLTLD